jgi:hypothetical protein
MSTLDNSWDDHPAIRGTGEHGEDAPGDATRRLSGRSDDRRMNELLCLDNSQKKPMICFEIINFLKTM